MVDCVLVYYQISSIQLTTVSGCTNSSLRRCVCSLKRELPILNLTVFAEAPIIPRTVFDLWLWIDVQEGAFLVATLPWRLKKMKCLHQTFSDRQTQVKCNDKAGAWTDRILSRSSIRASWSCHTRGETRTGLPSCTALWASVYTPPSSLRWCDGTGTSRLQTPKDDITSDITSRTCLTLTLSWSGRKSQLDIDFSLRSWFNL